MTARLRLRKVEAGSYETPDGAYWVHHDADGFWEIAVNDGRSWVVGSVRDLDGAFPRLRDAREVLADFLEAKK